MGGSSSTASERSKRVEVAEVHIGRISSIDPLGVITAFLAGFL